MSIPQTPLAGEGYVLTSYGPVKYLQQAVAAAHTLRRYDRTRPVALYASEEHLQTLETSGMAHSFTHLFPLPEAHRSITGVKHHLHRFMPFERTLWMDADMVWCRNPDPLWISLRPFDFTATGLEKADFWFGGPKGPAIIIDILLDRRRRTMQRFGLTHLPRIQSGLMYGSDREKVEEVMTRARYFLSRQADTHFRSRLHESGRTLESCEWSLAMAMAELRKPIYPWFNGYFSPQLDYIDTLTTHDEDFRNVTCRYYCDRFVYSLRGLPQRRLRQTLMRLVSQLPGKGDYMDVTPFALHFGWLHQKAPFEHFARRIWEQFIDAPPPLSHSHRHQSDAEP